MEEKPDTNTISDRLQYLIGALLSIVMIAAYLFFAQPETVVSERLEPVPQTEN